MQYLTPPNGEQRPELSLMTAGRHLRAMTWGT